MPWSCKAWHRLSSWKLPGNIFYFPDLIVCLSESFYYVTLRGPPCVNQLECPQGAEAKRPAGPQTRLLVQHNGKVELTLDCVQAFSDEGANTGCNGEATLRSVFNFWKEQVIPCLGDTYPLSLIGSLNG